MKRLMKLEIVCSIVVCGLFLLCASTVNASEIYDISQIISEKTEEVVLEDIESIKDISLYYSDNMMLESSEIYNLNVCTPYFVYSLDDASQSEIYYYPIANGSGEIVLNVEVMKNIENNWTYTISTKDVDFMNYINYNNNDYIVYKSDSVLYWECENSLYKTDNCKIDNGQVIEFQSLTSEEKYNKIINRICSYDNIKVKINETMNLYDGYTPTMTGVTCQLYNPKGQGNYNLCWAACVATIANYRKGTNLTAKRVADDEGVAYDSGGSSTNILNSLHRYGMTKYNYYESRISWSAINNNIINNQRPFYMRMTATFGGETHGHGIVGFGCKELNQSRYLNIWNPGDNSGDGKASIVRYENSSVSISYGGHTWTWWATFSRYN